MIAPRDSFFPDWLLLCDEPGSVCCPAWSEANVESVELVSSGCSTGTILERGSCAARGRALGPNEPHSRIKEKVRRLGRNNLSRGYPGEQNAISGDGRRRYLRKSILFRRNRGINFANGRAFFWRFAAFDLEALSGAGSWPGIRLRTVVLTGPVTLRRTPHFILDG
jgi:hypothetical protein